MARIVVSGYMLRHPVAGNLLAFFHYIAGLRRLGHEVLYLEESGWANASYDPIAEEYGEHPAHGLRVVRELIAGHRLDVPVCFVHRESGHVDGLEWAEVREALAGADLLVNVGGVCWLPEFRRCRCLALIDMDPLFTQLGRFGAEGFGDYHVYFSYGANIGQPGCSVPDAGIDWIPTHPPVVCSMWANGRTSSATPRVQHAGVFTTIANWNAYQGITHENRHYGQKDEEFARLIDLPRRTDQPLELALSGISVEQKRQLEAAGWSIRPAETVSTHLSTYQSYVQSSRGELSAAKNAYVQTRSGWFSDRSVCYLAAGRPVVLQDSGFSDWLPVGEGVLAFSNIDEAVTCLEQVNSDYARHRRAAARTAETVFEASVVLSRLVEIALAGARPAARRRRHERSPRSSSEHGDRAS